MAKNAAGRIACAATLAAGLWGGVSGQQLALDSLFRAHRLPLAYADSSMSGPGWEFIAGEAARAQFVVVGESHNVREIPLFTAQLFRLLHERSGFNYLALEDGPYAVRMLMAPGVRGDRDRTAALATRYLNALQFLNDQEIELIVTAGRVSTAAGEPVWGLDQTWGALHVLERLGELAAGGEAGELAMRLAAQARLVEAERPGEGHPRYMTDRLAVGDLDALRAAFAGGPAEAIELVGMLRTSYEIYASRGGGPSIYQSNDRRERYMRSRFVEEYERARMRDGVLPRVVLKFGQWHALKGLLNWGDVEPLGTFVSELAKGNALESVHIWTGLVNEPGRFWTLFDSPDYVPLARAGSTDGWWVVDLRAIRPHVAAGQVAGVNEEMRKVIFGFDLALLIGNGNRATLEWLQRAAR